MITIYLKQYNKIIRNADTKLFDELGYDDILWIDMLLPTIKEQKAVENFMEISLQTKQQVEEIESTSKYSENENAIISNSNFFVPTGDTFIVEPVSFIISNEGVLVSVRSADTRDLSGQCYGSMLLKLPTDVEQAKQAAAYMRAQPGITVEEVTGE